MHKRTVVSMQVLSGLTASKSEPDAVMRASPRPSSTENDISPSGAYRGEVRGLDRLRSGVAAGRDRVARALRPVAPVGRETLLSPPTARWSAEGRGFVPARQSCGVTSP